jgi:Dockerin type I domain
MRVDSIDNTISGLTYENSALDIRVNSPFDPAKPVVITNNEFRNSGQGVNWTNKTVVGDNSLPSVVITNNHFLRVARGVIYEQGIWANDLQTAWALVTNNTFEQLNVIAFEPPTLFPAISPCDTGFAALGVAEFDGNVMINCNGVTMPPDVCSITPAGFVASGTSIPEKNGEFEIALDPDPNYTFGGYLADLYGGGNFTTNPNFTTHLRPLPGPAAPGDGTWSGAKPPAGDYNADGFVDDADQIEMQRVLDKQQAGETLTTNELESFDLNGDDKVTESDIMAFCSIFTGVECLLLENIPAASTWSILAMLLLLASAGTVVMIKRPVLR